MKNSLKIVVVLIALAFTTTSIAQCNGGNGDQGLINRAIQAARDCFPDNIQNLEIGGNVETVSICFFTGSIKKVTLYSSPRCIHPPCPMFASRLVATVVFGCDGHIVSVECL